MTTEPSTLPIIDPKMAAEALRRIAAQLDSGRYHIEEMSHQVWSQRKQWLTVKWDQIS